MAITGVAQKSMSEASTELFDLARATADGNRNTTSVTELVLHYSSYSCIEQVAILVLEEKRLSITIRHSSFLQWHISLYRIQVTIAVATRKVLDYQIQSKVCLDCRAHSNWDQATVKYQKWKTKHKSKCDIKQYGGIGAKTMRCRSLDKHNLRYTIILEMVTALPTKELLKPLHMVTLQYRRVTAQAMYRSAWALH